MKSRLFVMTVLVIVLTAFLYACTDSQRTTIKVGVVLPLSGEFQIYGHAGLRGAKLAVKEINESGGLLDGRMLELVVGDNMTDPSESIRLAREMIQNQRVIALMGPVSSAARNAMLVEARKFKVPLLYGIDYEGGEYDRYLFCYSTIPDHYVNPVVPPLLEQFGKRVYIFGYDYIWPHKMSEAIERVVAEHGGVVVGKEFTPFGVEDFSPVIERIKHSRADILMLIQPGTDGFRFISQFNAAGQKAKTKVLAFAADESYLSALPADDLEGVFTGLHFFSSLQTDGVQEFLANYKKVFPDMDRPTFSTEAHYQLIKLFANAIQKAETLDREHIIDAMEGTSFTTAGGSARLREDHHFDLSMFLGEFLEGDLVVKRAFGVVSPEDQRNEAQ